MTYKKRVIHMLSLFSLFLSGIVIGNSCNAINRGKADDKEKSLTGSPEHKDSRLTSTSNVGMDQVALKDLSQSFEGALREHSLGHLRYAPLVLEDADFDNNDGKDAFVKTLESFSSECYDSYTQRYIKTKFLALTSSNDNEALSIRGVPIQNHEYKQFGMAINDVAKYMHGLHEIIKEVQSLWVKPNKTDVDMWQPFMLRMKLKDMRRMTSKKLRGFVETDSNVYQIIRERTGDSFKVEEFTSMMSRNTDSIFKLIDKCQEMCDKALKKS